MLNGHSCARTSALVFLIAGERSSRVSTRGMRKRAEERKLLKLRPFGTRSLTLRSKLELPTWSTKILATASQTSRTLAPSKAQTFAQRLSSIPARMRLLSATLPLSHSQDLSILRAGALITSAFTK